MPVITWLLILMVNHYKIFKQWYRKKIISNYYKNSCLIRPNEILSCQAYVVASVPHQLPGLDWGHSIWLSSSLYLRGSLCIYCVTSRLLERWEYFRHVPATYLVFLKRNNAAKKSLQSPKLLQTLFEAEASHSKLLFIGN